MPRTPKSVWIDEPLCPAATRYLESKKKGTAEAYSTCLKRFQAFYRKSLADFIDEIEQQQVKNRELPLSQRERPGEQVIQRFVHWLEANNYSPKSIRQSTAAIQNALKYYGVSVSMEFVRQPPDRTLEENKKHEWSLDQVREFIKVAEYLRDKAFILFQFQSGLGSGDIIDLDYKDIKREFEAGIAPMVIEGYRNKTGVPIRTFVGWDALFYLKLYLEGRPDLKDNSPLFTKLGSEERVTTDAISKKLREYAGKLDFIYEEDLEEGYNPARPHSLRAGFRSRLTGKMDGELIEFFMSHGNLPAQRRTYMNQPLDELREIYSNYEHLLSIETTSKEQLKQAELKGQVTQQAFNNLKNTVADLAETNAELQAKLEQMEIQQRETMELFKKVADKLAETE